jgi:hypothetical protein
VRSGYTVIRDLLPFIKGREYDDVSKSYVSSLRPSKVDIIDSQKIETGDFWSWRVRVYVKDGLITDIAQEVEFEIYGDIQHGHDLRLRLNESTKGTKNER